MILILALIGFAAAAVLSSISLAVPDGAARNITGSIIGVVANALTVPLVALGSYRLYRALLAQASSRRAA